jgi:hypothetical protein
MQIDESDEQFSNAPAPRYETRQSDSKITRETVSHPEKQPSASRSIFVGIVTSDPSPRYRLIVIPSESTRNEPLTPKWQFPSPNKISRTFVPDSAKPLNSSRPDGMKNVDNAEQSENA